MHDDCPALKRGPRMRGQAALRKLLFLFLFSMGHSWGLVIEHPSDKAARSGDTIQFSCQISAAANVQWEFNGTPIPGATSRTLELAGVDVTHQGFYRAKVFYDDIEEYTAEARLIIYETPPNELPRLITDLSDRSDIRVPISDAVTFKGEIYYHYNRIGVHRQLWKTDGSNSNNRQFLFLPDDVAVPSIKEQWPSGTSWRRRWKPAC